MYRLVCIVILIFEIARGVSGTEVTPVAPIAQGGVLDLSNWDFALWPQMNLSGSWLLYEGRLLTPEDIAVGGSSLSSMPIVVPGLWRKQKIGDKMGPVFGEGTVALSVILPDDRPELTLKIDHITTSSLLFLNGKAQGVQPVTDPRRMGDVEDNASRYYRVAPGIHTLDLVIQITGYWDSFGMGISVAPLLGETGSMEHLRGLNIVYEALLSGILIMAGLYHFMLFLIQRKDKALLLFSLILVMVLLRHLSTSEQFLFTQIGLRYFADLRIEHTSVYSSGLLFALYFQSMYPRQSCKVVSRFLAAIGFVLFCLAAFAPPRLFTGLLFFMNIYIGLIGLDAVYVLARAIREREPQAWVMFFGSLCVVLPSGLDIINTHSNMQARYLTPLGLLPFIMAQSYLLANRYTRDAKEAEKLRVTAARLTELDQVKTNFLANVSHELRTPLTLISAPLTAIRSGEYGDSIPKGHRVFGLIQENAERLLRLVENLLSITRLESRQPYELAVVDLTRLTPMLVGEFESLAKERGIRLAYRDDRGDGVDAVPVEVDRRSFETIFFNLMSNALKFTREGGHVEVRLRLGKLEVGAARGKQCAFLEIADTGIGIASEDIPNLFERYRQIYDKERYHYDGNGIGLSLSREEARALGGDILVESEEGKGSVFTIVLPIASGQAEKEGCLVASRAGVRSSSSPRGAVSIAPIETKREAGASRQRRVLVVEDQRDLRVFIAEGLSSEWTVLQATDGVEAKEALEKNADNPPDVIISDIMMPRLDGIRLFDATRADPRFATIPFLFLTAREEPEERVRLLREGAIDYIVKPFSLEELRARIGAVTALREGERRELEARIAAALGSSVPLGAGGVARTEYPADLSSREVEALDLVVAGLSDKEIAERLGISTRTASNHVAAVLRKTGLSSRQSLKKRFGA